MERKKFLYVVPVFQAVYPKPFQNFLGTMSTMLIEALAPLIAAAVYGILWRAYQFIKTHLSVKQYQLLDYLVTTAVQAAEQTGLSNQIQNTARAKKASAPKVSIKKSTV